MSYSTIRTRDEGSIRYLQLYRPEARNTINAQLIEECNDAVAAAEGQAAVLVIEGLPDVFCFGADFQGMRDALVQGEVGDDDGAGADKLYRLWLRIATGPFITVAHVRGQANAGGMGFVSACDIVLADAAARFSLSELLFGLYPACVLPFLIRRIGLTKANYMTVSTQPVGVEQVGGNPETHDLRVIVRYSEPSIVTRASREASAGVSTGVGRSCTRQPSCPSCSS